MSKAANPFQYIEAINTKDLSDIIDDDYEGYNPFLTLRNFGNYRDTVLIANEINGPALDLPKSLQFSYLYTSIRKGKRWSKWDRPDENEAEELRAIMKKYNVSERIARQYHQTLPKETIAEIVYNYNLTK